MILDIANLACPKLDFYHLKLYPKPRKIGWIVKAELRLGLWMLFPGSGLGRPVSVGKLGFTSPRLDLICQIGQEIKFYAPRPDLVLQIGWGNQIFVLHSVFCLSNLVVGRIWCPLDLILSVQVLAWLVIRIVTNFLS